jgi:tetratricopeptide (TPR) repeat protein
MEHLLHESKSSDFRTNSVDSADEPTIKTLRRWKDQCSLPQSALVAVESLHELSQSEKLGLHSLFNRTLQHNAAKREITIAKITEGLIYRKPGTSSNLDKCSVIQCLNHYSFRLVVFLPHLSLLSHQLRLKIHQTLASTLLLWDTDKSTLCCQSCSENVAFQLALSFYVRQVGPNNVVESKKWLERSSRDIQDLEKELDSLRDGKITLEYTGEFEQLKNEGLIHLPDFTAQYGCSSLNQDEALRQEVAGFSSALGDSHFVTIMLKLVLASIFKDKLAYAEALRLEQECLEVLQKSTDDDRRFEVKLMLRLGLTYSEQEKYQEALELQEKGVCLTKAIFHSEHPTTLSAAANLACTHWKMGDWTRPAAEFTHLSEKAKVIFGPCHPESLSLTANLAMALKRLKRQEEALILEESVAKQCLETLGPEHAMTWRIVTNLAQTYISQNRFINAEEALKSLDIPDEKFWADMATEKWRTLNVLALAYSSQRRYENAQHILNMVIKIEREALGSANPDTIRASLMLSRLEHDNEKPEHSVFILEQTLKDFAEQAASEDTSRLSSLEVELAQHCKLLGLWDRAAPLERTIVANRRKILGLDHTDTLEAMASLCETLVNQGKYKEMDEFYLLITEERLSSITDEDVATAILVPLAKCGSKLLDQDQELGRAQKFLEKVSTCAWKSLGQSHLVTLNALANLASAYALNGVLDQAYSIYVKVLKIKVRAFGQDDQSTLATVANFRYFCECVDIEADGIDQILEHQNQIE